MRSREKAVGGTKDCITVTPTLPQRAGETCISCQKKSFKIAFFIKNVLKY